MKDQYFDLDDYNTPIKTYYADKYTFFGNSEFTTEATFYLQDNQAILNDNYLALNGQEEVKKFISIGDHQSLISKLIPNNVFKMTIQKNEEYLVYERSVYTLLDFLGDLGGIYEIFITLGFVFVTLFTCTKFYYSILPKIYQVDTLGCQIDHVSNENRRIEQTIQQSMSLNRTQNEEFKHSSSMTERQLESDRYAQHEKKLIMKAQKNMQNRRSYNFTNCDVLYNVW